jgi:hypothetical protein
MHRTINHHITVKDVMKQGINVLSSFIHSFILSFIHSFIHSFIPWSSIVVQSVVNLIIILTRGFLIITTIDDHRKKFNLVQRINQIFEPLDFITNSFILLFYCLLHDYYIITIRVLNFYKFLLLCFLLLCFFASLFFIFHLSSFISVFLC